MFEWDDEKAASNLLKHGVSFEQAQGVFEDLFALAFEDNRSSYGESRFVQIGVVQDRLLTVVYVNKGDVIRIISARRAEPQERRWYHEES